MQKIFRKICPWKAVILVIRLLVEAGPDNSTVQLPPPKLFGYLVNCNPHAPPPPPPPFLRGSSPFKLFSYMVIPKNILWKICPWGAVFLVIWLFVEAGPDNSTVHPPRPKLLGYLVNCDLWPPPPISERDLSLFKLFSYVVIPKNVFWKNMAMRSSYSGYLVISGRLSW